MIPEEDRSFVWLAWLIAILICVGWISYALAHDHWINRKRLIDPVTKEWCCNEHDCADETSNVEEVPGGFLIKSTGEIIPESRVIWRAPAGEWWRCRYIYGPNADKTRCLIGPAQTG